jgi:hypothetical protein
MIYWQYIHRMANAFLFPGVNSRAELVASPVAVPTATLSHQGKNTKLF